MSPIPLDSLRAYLLSKKGATEETPFGPDVLVFKVMGKMFALLAWQADPLRISLKCDPDDALALRKQYMAVRPGYYMNKRHWNTITLDGSIPEGEIWAMIDDSYALVARGLKKALREELEMM
ncbi:MAG: MmcQ/YjbR family DNA-binding protein [Clostridia bacterium]|nr:MAG: MmcQ/YjbR family DNA-binding protein [Clostridia bacterium]